MKGCFRTLALLLDARIHVNVNVLRIIKMTLFKLHMLKCDFSLD